MNYSISVFFPAYNEEKNIEETVRKATEVLGSITDTYEIIIINDGSKDGTLKIARELAQKYNRVKIVNHEHNKGYGGSVQSGIQAAIYDYTFFSDADLQFDLQEINLLLAHISHHDAIIGYRKNRQDPFIRLVNAKLWNMANRLLFGLHFKDIDCAFKIFKTEAVKGITLTSKGAMISPEILFKVSRRGYSIKEIPVTHFPRLHGKPTGAKLSVIFRAMKEMIRFYIAEVIKRK